MEPKKKFEISKREKSLKKSPEALIPAKNQDALERFLVAIDKNVAALEEVNSIAILLVKKAQELRKLQKELASLKDDERSRDTFHSNDLEDQIAEKIAEIEELIKKWRKIVFEIELEYAQELEHVKEESKKRQAIN